MKKENKIIKNTEDSPIPKLTKEEIRVLQRERVRSLSKLPADHPIARTISELSKVKDK